MTAASGFASVGSPVFSARTLRAWWVAALTAAMLFLLSACGAKELHSGLDEAQANEMVAVLMNAGIDAEKAKGDKESWSVSVSDGDFARAVDIVRNNGLPRKQYDSLGTVFQKGTYNSSQTEEHARFIHALQQELMGTISKVDGVVESSVHLNIPPKSELGEERGLASASVFIKYRPGFDLRSRTAEIKTMVGNSVDSLSHDRISVFMEESKAIPKPRSSFVEDAISGGLWVLGTLLALGLAGYAAYYLYQRRQAAAARPAVPAETTPPSAP